MKIWFLPLHVLSETNIADIKSLAKAEERLTTNKQMSKVLYENTILSSKLEFVFRTLKKMKITKGLSPTESNSLLRELEV